MKNKTNICKICNCEILNQEAIFYFPKLPQWHDLSDLNESKLHINCVKNINQKRKIGSSLADITQDLAKNSEVSPFIYRDGDIVLRARLDEEVMEILNFEDFCVMSVSKSILENIQESHTLKSIKIGVNTLHILNGEDLRIEYKNFIQDLSELNLSRLKNILKNIIIEDCFKNSWSNYCKKIREE